MIEELAGSVALFFEAVMQMIALFVGQWHGLSVLAWKLGAMQTPSSKNLGQSPAQT